MENKLQILKDIFSQEKIILTDEQADKFITYYSMLIEWNEKMNLTAITEYNDVVIKHFVDSVTIMNLNILKEGIKIIDVGTGAGFPGIPISILFPSIHITLMDSLNKRITFLNEVCRKLNLNNVECIHARAEELGRKDEYRETFDICVSRAVAELRTLCEYSIPFVKVNGYFVAYKSQKAREEIEDAGNAIKCLSCKIEECKEFTLNNSCIERNLIMIRKCMRTDKKYPRAGGKPLSSPL